MECTTASTNAFQMFVFLQHCMVLLCFLGLNTHTRIHMQTCIIFEVLHLQTHNPIWLLEMKLSQLTRLCCEGNYGVNFAKLRDFFCIAQLKLGLCQRQLLRVAWAYLWEFKEKSGWVFFRTEETKRQTDQIKVKDYSTLSWRHHRKEVSRRKRWRCRGRNWIWFLLITSQVDTRNELLMWTSTKQGAIPLIWRITPRMSYFVENKPIIEAEWIQIIWRGTFPTSTKNMVCFEIRSRRLRTKYFFPNVKVSFKWETFVNVE